MDESCSELGITYLSSRKIIRAITVINTIRHWQWRCRRGSIVCCSHCTRQKHCSSHRSTGDRHCHLYGCMSLALQDPSRQPTRTCGTRDWTSLLGLGLFRHFQAKLCNGQPKLHLNIYALFSVLFKRQTQFRPRKPVMVVPQYHKTRIGQSR